jgi:hypothetical protein
MPLTTWLSRWKAPQVLSRTAEIGWVLDAEKAGFIWDAPRRLANNNPPATHAKSVAFCPAMIDHEARIYEVPCPIDVQLRIGMDERTKQPVLVNAAGEQATIRNKALGQMAVLVNRREWRHPDRPIVQITTPYLFVADEPVYMTQMPPFNHLRVPQLPGLVIGGRLPIHIWPRHMMWAFEWHDPKQPIELKRGEPWFYVRFETSDPSRPVRLSEAEMAPPLKEYLAGMTTVANYVNRTFSLFKTAQQRRPKQLLFKKER